MGFRCLHFEHGHIYDNEWKWKYKLVLRNQSLIQRIMKLPKINGVFHLWNNHKQDRYLSSRNELSTVLFFSWKLENQHGYLLQFGNFSLLLRSSTALKAFLQCSTWILESRILNVQATFAEREKTVESNSQWEEGSLWLRSLCVLSVCLFSLSLVLGF